MPENTCDRREILKSLLAGLSLLSWDWNAFPRGWDPFFSSGDADFW